ncbi:MAG TPA: hypothetical protein VHZ52_10370, partial [Acidobacteriaceae bacterium]|nr:hypothetical protein [Acidobacteriaceae bacterium]
GRFCELAAKITKQDETEQYLLGMLSLVPAMLGVPMVSVVKALPLRQEVRQALLGERKAERRLLDWLVCHEQAKWLCCDAMAEDAGLVADSLQRIYAEALVWAEANMAFAGK